MARAWLLGLTLMNGRGHFSNGLCKQEEVLLPGLCNRAQLREEVIPECSVCNYIVGACSNHVTARGTRPPYYKSAIDL